MRQPSAVLRRIIVSVVTRVFSEQHGCGGAITSRKFCMKGVNRIRGLLRF